MSTLYLCGAGNGEGIRLALRVQHATARWDRLVLLDDDPTKLGQRRLDLEVAGPFELLTEADPARDEVVNLVTRTTRGRERARARIASFGIPVTSLVHPDVDLLGTRLEDGVTVYTRAVIGADARVARSSVVLVGGVVGHGSDVGEGCIVAPHAVINARVRLEREVYVGSNASILPDLTIGAGATIAGNTLVVTDVPAGATAIGVPASIVPALNGAPDSNVPCGANAALPVVPECSVAAPCGRAVKLEADILAIVGNVLGLESVPQDGNFFDIGGTSLKALLLRERLRVQLGLDVELVDLYRHPTVESLSGYLAGNASGAGALGQAGRRAALRRQRGFH